ncbi:MAG: hypothetical protein QFX35_05105 [Candidatus Verstraetearchaeota archaeon]|nr:hypothetical protein [Candidatus Verstraetearchaeota archaeon]
MTMRWNTHGMRVTATFLALLFAANIPLIAAAPSGNIYFPEGAVSSADNVLTLGGTANVTVSFKNTAGSDVTDVASTIQYVTLAAAVVNPTRTQLMLNATWEIYAPSSSVPRATGTLIGTLDTSAIFAPYSNTSSIYLYTWSLGPPNSTLTAYTDSSQFNDGLRVLRPSEILNLTVTEVCQNVVGDCRIWFFFLATEFEPATWPTALSQIPEAQRVNLYYSKAPGSTTVYWFPLHNSYDPYDPDIKTGHAFGQHSWSRNPTENAYAKSNKLVHQKPSEDPVQETYSFHICGIKFSDLNLNGIYEPAPDEQSDIVPEPGIDGLNVTLLGADGITPAEIYYAGDFEYPSNEANPMATGENLLPGSYCFNLKNVSTTGGDYNNGTYVFYVRLDEPLIYVNTTPTLIGPIVLIASAGGPRESLNNHFGNAPPTEPPPEPEPEEERVPAVGGELLAVDLQSILADALLWNIVFLGAVVAASMTLTAIIRKR